MDKEDWVTLALMVWMVAIVTWIVVLGTLAEFGVIGCD